MVKIFKRLKWVQRVKRDKRVTKKKMSQKSPNCKKSQKGKLFNRVEMVKALKFFKKFIRVKTVTWVKSQGIDERESRRIKAVKTKKG